MPLHPEMEQNRLSWDHISIQEGICQRLGLGDGGLSIIAKQVKSEHLHQRIGRWDAHFISNLGLG